ncbi:stimulator of interferon genes protein homolog [Lutzomyia longipalpis]|uniref:stimulator of interferon genes protein homolog n=1 Tax=Lutzomyia longipalpis TaxID=7200 RepID=UPI0024835E70|nr:stimulator of interferon genes protein homolog [Lutzomyia longipalpis]
MQELSLHNVIFLLTLVSTGKFLWYLIHFIRDTIPRKNDVNRQAKMYFNDSWPYLIIMTCQMVYYISLEKYDDLCSFTIYSAIYATILFLCQNWDDKTLLAKKIFLRNSYDLDRASGMAENFYHGYLNIILPHRGDGNKGIVERINDFEDKEGITIPVKKLLLVLPRDLYFPPLLSDASNKIQTIANLEGTRRDRAGTTNRIYKNSVYKLLPQNYYVVAEAATPLLSFYEGIKNQDSESKILAEEVYEKFCKYIEDLLKSSPECRDLIIPVRVPNRDSGESADLAKILSDVIEK